MVVLGIDTATSRGSVALARDSGIVATIPLLERGAHARDLLLRIEELLAGASLSSADLGGVAVTLGPGSFTGVRIGMATAKGLAYSLGISLTGLSTLEVLARAALPDRTSAPRSLCAVMDAGRGEVYAALFTKEGDELRRDSADRSYRPADLADIVPPGACAAGDGSGLLRGALSGSGRDIEVIEPWPALAGPLALWACMTLAPGSGYDSGGVRPNYIRPSDAEGVRR
jgi:tRNA threonylcarbamoyladenosine biosynthesis protein TsaB